MAIQTDYSTPAAALGRRAHSHREALSLAAFLVDKVLRSHSLNGEVLKNRDVMSDDSFELRMESGGLHAQFEGIITVLLR